MAEAGGEEQRDSVGPVSFADLGIPQPPKLQDTLLGKARQFQDVEMKERVYVVVSVITLLATFAFTVYKIATVSTSDPDFTFALVLLVSTLFGSYYVVHGVLQERATEILIFSIATFAVLIYLIVNYAAGKKDSVKLGRLIVAAVLCPVLVAMGAHLCVQYYRSGNLIFRMVGANAQLQFMCRLLFLFFDCLKFDLQLGISMVILILVSRLNVDTEDIVVLSVGGTVTIAWFFLGYYTMKRENKIGALVFFVFSPLEIGYVIYKLVQVADYINTYSGVAGSTIACGILALSVRVIVMIVSVFVVRNFNKGLKEKGKS
ncbi:hypothetical protein BaRGS_00006166 [Batillaria attramentaria]|uniref:DUF7789 domain-containing protein n=1 Tax=Batillaria attramentaria TaxID=370345 RepID=A0ABD0LU45_9CAEN